MKNISELTDNLYSIKSIHNDWLLYKSFSLLPNNFQRKSIIFPPSENVFKAFEISPKEIKLVILGQDPYHNFGEAQGLCFSVGDEIKKPPSLQNIIKEISYEFNIDYKNLKKNDLSFLKNQGVFLINTILTVEKNTPLSHKKLWGSFVFSVLSELYEKQKNIVFILWGSHAKSFGNYVVKNNNNHLFLYSAHPSPLSSYRGFFGNNHFVLANNFFEKNNIEKIDWVSGLI